MDLDPSKMNVYRRRELLPEMKEVTRMHLDKIYEYMLKYDKIPSVKDVMEITGLAYDYAGQVRRRALREFPKLDMDEVGFAVRKLLMDRLRSGEIENSNLVKLMPWVAAPITPALDVKQEIVHRFVVIKPGDEEPAEEEAEDN